MNAKGKRSIIGVSTSLSEAEVHWREFLSGLMKRGLTGVRMFTSDSHEGLKAALRAVCPGVPWQRCQFYLQQNASHYVPKVEMRKKAASDIKAIFNAADEHQAAELLKKTVEAYHKTAPRLA